MNKMNQVITKISSTGTSVILDENKRCLVKSVICALNLKEGSTRGSLDVNLVFKQYPTDVKSAITINLLKDFEIRGGDSATDILPELGYMTGLYLDERDVISINIESTTSSEARFTNVDGNNLTVMVVYEKVV